MYVTYLVVEILSRGDPELGGFRPLPVGYTPQTTPSVGRGVRDPFGWADLGGQTTTGSRGDQLCRAHGPRKRAPGAEGKGVIIRRYSTLRKREDWWVCRDLVAELLTLDLPPIERAEALFALGYAQEKLDNRREAIVAYMQSLETDADNGKSVRGLARLESD